MACNHALFLIAVQHPSLLPASSPSTNQRDFYLQCFRPARSALRGTDYRGHRGRHMNDVNKNHKSTAQDQRDSKVL